MFFGHKKELLPSVSSLFVFQDLSQQVFSRKKGPLWLSVSDVLAVAKSSFKAAHLGSAHPAALISSH